MIKKEIDKLIIENEDTKIDVCSLIDFLDTHIKSIEIISDNEEIRKDVIVLFKTLRNLKFEAFTWKNSNGEEILNKEMLIKYFSPKWDPRYNRPRILIDFDDVINNFMYYLCKVYNERTGKHITPSQVKEWDIEKYMGPEAIAMFREEGFFEQVPEKRHSISTLKKLIASTDYDVYIITACGTNHELEEKYRWLDKYLPSFNKDRIIKCKEKEIIRGDVLIDDKVANLDKCAPYMRCILYDMASNRDCNAYPRIKSLKQIIPMLNEWFYPGENKLYE